jgi:hypothetical protein
VTMTKPLWSHAHGIGRFTHSPAESRLQIGTDACYQLRAHYP